MAFTSSFIGTLDLQALPNLFAMMEPGSKCAHSRRTADMQDWKREGIIPALLQIIAAQSIDLYDYPTCELCDTYLACGIHSASRQAPRFGLKTVSTPATPSNRPTPGVVISAPPAIPTVKPSEAVSSPSLLT
ncbi:hypothetical protein D9756_009611 [Leucocoprinus leucothites]|uniref:Uncharacterized protein n=1 Tax=Leucocoprinus leucothites TaxID=201217 RepID=A0A8H5CV49_9AGAR|nr:hypothetical protein D9756_009611 [Leucoagaricus leucothites]